MEAIIAIGLFTFVVYVLPLLLRIKKEGITINSEIDSSKSSETDDWKNLSKADKIKKLSDIIISVQKETGTHLHLILNFEYVQSLMQKYLISSKDILIAIQEANKLSLKEQKEKIQKEFENSLFLAEKSIAKKHYLISLENRYSKMSEEDIKSVLLKNS